MSFETERRPRPHLNGANGGVHRVGGADADRQVRRLARGRARQRRSAASRSSAAVERAGLPEDTPIDEVLMGQVLQAGVGQAPARQAALKAGLPDSTSATTINRVCGSGLKAIMLAAAEIRAGDAEVVVAGGMENMNQGPYLIPKARFGYRLGNAEMIDATVHDGLWCSTESCHMGTHAERVAIKAEVSREDQDQFALESHQQRARRDRRRPLRRGDRAGAGPARQGAGPLRHRRGPPPRHEPRGAGPT